MSCSKWFVTILMLFMKILTSRSNLKAGWVSNKTRRITAKTLKWVGFGPLCTKGCIILSLRECSRQTNQSTPLYLNLLTRWLYLIMEIGNGARFKEFPNQSLVVSLTQNLVTDYMIIRSRWKCASTLYWHKPESCDHMIRGDRNT